MTWNGYYHADKLPALVHIYSWDESLYCTIHHPEENVYIHEYHGSRKEWRWKRGCVHRFEGPALVYLDHPDKMFYLFGRYGNQHEHAADVKKMERVKRFIRTRKLRRFLRLCRSREFNEYFYAEGRMGRGWDHAKILSMDKSTEP